MELVIHTHLIADAEMSVQRKTQVLLDEFIYTDQYGNHMLHRMRANSELLPVDYFTFEYDQGTVAVIIVTVSENVFPLLLRDIREKHIYLSLDGISKPILVIAVRPYDIKEWDTDLMTCDQYSNLFGDEDPVLGDLTECDILGIEHSSRLWDNKPIRDAVKTQLQQKGFGYDFSGEEQGAPNGVPVQIKNTNKYREIIKNAQELEQLYEIPANQQEFAQAIFGIEEIISIGDMVDDVLAMMPLVASDIQQDLPPLTDNDIS